MTPRTESAPATSPAERRLKNLRASAAQYDIAATRYAARGNTVEASRCGAEANALREKAAALAGNGSRPEALQNANRTVDEDEMEIVHDHSREGTTKMDTSMVKLEHLTWDAAEAAGLRTKTSWSQAGRSLVPNAKPAALHHGKYDTYFLYAESQSRPKRVVTEKPAVPIDLLAAIFTVTRSAKRYRDSAQTCYQHRKHGFARMARKQKEYLYELKDDGIVAAFRQGRVQAVGTHGCLAVYRGEGYCYHSLLHPKGTVLPELKTRGTTDTGNEPLTVEAKPRGTKEPRLKDACHTLEELPKLAEEALASGEFVRLSFPPRQPEPRYHDRYYDEEADDYDEFD
jgi:hypothetical protein